jgi:hypothetical protein
MTQISVLFNKFLGIILSEKKIGKSLKNAEIT